MSWQRPGSDLRLTAIGLPSAIKNQLVQEKARTGKCFAQLVCEALMERWQRQGSMATPTVAGVPPRYYVPPKIYPPQPPAPVPSQGAVSPAAGAAYPGSVPGVPHAGPVGTAPAVIPNPATRELEVVGSGRWQGYRLQRVGKPAVPPWNL